MYVQAPDGESLSGGKGEAGLDWFFTEPGFGKMAGKEPFFEDQPDFGSGSFLAGRPKKGCFRPAALQR
jgi:hypothetical protein